jgi:hypothetical protein
VGSSTSGDNCDNICKEGAAECGRQLGEAGAASNRLAASEGNRKESVALAKDSGPKKTDGEKGKTNLVVPEFRSVTISFMLVRCISKTHASKNLCRTIESFAIALHKAA